MHSTVTIRLDIEHNENVPPAREIAEIVERQTGHALTIIGGAPVVHPIEDDIVVNATVLSAFVESRNSPLEAGNTVRVRYQLTGERRIREAVARILDVTHDSVTFSGRPFSGTFMLRRDQLTAVEVVDPSTAAYVNRRAARA